MIYLTEKNLIDYLSDIYPNTIWIHNKTFNNYKFRPDYVNHELKIVIEFNGYQHYTKASVIIKDYNKYKIITDMGYKLIEIPYFVQLDKLVIKNLFNVNWAFDDLIKYPHGFIDNSPTMILPSDFCSLGIERFMGDLSRFNYIKDLIIESLYNKFLLLGDKKLVLPPQLIYLLDRYNTIDSL